MENPVFIIIKEHFEKSGLSTRELINQILLHRGGKFDRVSQNVHSFLRGESFSMEYALRIANELAIPADFLEDTFETYVRTLRKLAEREQRQRLRVTTTRWSPHLWAITLPSYRPPILKFVGYDPRYLIKVPDEVAALPKFEEFRQVGELARDHYNGEKRSREVDGYLYHRSAFDRFEFSVKGELLGRRENPEFTLRPTDVIDGQRITGAVFSAVFRPHQDKSEAKRNDF